MTWTEMRNNTKLLKNEVDAKLGIIYEPLSINGQPFFKDPGGVIFHIVDLGEFQDALVIEYTDTWEDGDLFYPKDYDSLDEILVDMVKEIDNCQS